MSFAAGTNAYVDAIDKADTEVVLQGTADGGTVSVGKYIGEPKTAIPANDSVKLGGTGKNAMKFVDVKVDGATTGTAVVRGDTGFPFNRNGSGYLWRHDCNRPVFRGATFYPVRKFPVTKYFRVQVDCNGDGSITCLWRNYCLAGI